MELCETVDAGGIDRLRFGAGGVALRTAEDIVGRDMDERAVILSDSFGEIADGCRVEQFGQRGVILGLVDVGVGGAVDNHADVVVMYHFFDGCGIGDVELGHIGEDVIVTGTAGGIAEAVAQLTVGAGDKDIYWRFHKISGIIIGDKDIQFCLPDKIKNQRGNRIGRAADVFCPCRRGWPRQGRCASRCRAKCREWRCRRRPRGDSSCHTCTGTRRRR